MRAFVTHMALVGICVGTLTGCSTSGMQTPNFWPFAKKNGMPPAASYSSTAPSLPSAGATPLGANTPFTAPQTMPSSNYAAATSSPPGYTGAPAGYGSPTPSYGGTPTAYNAGATGTHSYTAPITGGTAYAPPSNSYAPPPTAGYAVASGPAASPAGMAPQTGYYNPNYGPGSAVSANNTPSTGADYRSATAQLPTRSDSRYDGYSAPPAATTPTAPASGYGTPTASYRTDDRYGNATGSTTGGWGATSYPTTGTAASQNNNSSVYGAPAATGSQPSTAPANTGDAYRPGGTGSYTPGSTWGASGSAVAPTGVQPASYQSQPHAATGAYPASGYPSTSYPSSSFAPSSSSAPASSSTPTHPWAAGYR